MSFSRAKVVILSLRSILPFCAAAAFLCGPSSIAQVHAGAAAQAHNRFGPDAAPEPVEPLVAPLFLQTDQIDSAVTVVNGVMQASPGTLTIRDLDGNIAAIKRITYAPHSSTVVQLREVLAEAGSTLHAGSVLLQQDSSIQGPALLAQLSLTMHTGSQSAFLEEEFGMPSAMMSSATLQGVASQTTNAPLVAITSTSEVGQTIQTSCLGDPSATPHTLELAAGATALIQACFGPASGPASGRRLRDSDLNGVAALTAHQQSAPTSMGLSIHSDGLPGAFYAFGFALNGSPNRAQLQPVDFYDPAMLGSTHILYAGVPVGAEELLQPGTYVPVATVANFSSQPRIVTIHHLDSSSAPSADSSGSIQPQAVRQLTLAPGSVQTMEMADLPGSGLQHSFTIDFDGKPGDVQAHLFAYRSSSDQRVELLAKDVADFHNGGNHPWSTANGNTSTLLLLNPTAQKQEFQVRVSGGGSTWLDLLYVAPFETRAVSINDLIAKEIGDHDHHKLPKSLQTGEVQWSTRMPSDGFGRLLVSNPTTGLSRSFSCEVSLALCSASLGPVIDEDIPVNDITDFYAIESTYCASPSPQSCYGTTVGLGLNFSTNWTSSSNTQIVNSTNTQVNLQGMSAGHFSYTGTVVSGSCQAPVGGSGMVQPLPHIYFNGADVTGKTLDVPVGVQVPLTTSISLPAGVTAANPTWSIPNGAVGGYTATTQSAYVTPPATTKTSTMIYWVNTGTYTVTYSTTLSNGFVASAQVKFYVVGPIITSLNTTHVGVSIGGNPYYLGRFALPNTYGITFNATLGPPFISGTLSFIQVVNGYTAQYFGGSPCSFNYGAGLDGLLPYDSAAANATSISTNDSPGIPLEINEVKSEAKAQFSATTFLMWTPSATPSISVPLANAAWQWQGDALNPTPSKPRTWVLNSTGNSSSTRDLAPSTTFPIWNNQLSIPPTVCP